MKMFVIACLSVGCHSASAPPSSPDDPSPDATSPSDAAPDAASIGALGVVSTPVSVPCQSGGDMCMTVQVSCPGIEPLGATMAITTPAQPTRTVAVLGPGGGTKLYDPANLVAQYAQKGFRVVQIAWDTEWELATTNPHVKLAACRTSTLFRWIYDHIHDGANAAPYCVHGSSGGAGAVGYALAQFGQGSFIDHALMSFGPVFSEIAYGCSPALYTGGPRFLCDALPDASFAYNRTNNAPSLNSWEGTQSCVIGTPSADDIDRWTADSSDTGGSFDYPQTGTSFYYCVPANAGAGLGTFFIDKVTAPVKTVTCFTDCTGEALGPDDTKMMVADMDRDCVTRH
jgi:hypothetical protein